MLPRQPILGCFVVVANLYCPEKPMPLPLRSAAALLGGLALAGCIYAPAPPPYYSYNPYDPGQRAVAGGLIGAGAGAALGGIAGGGQGAAIGALAGGAVGAVAGASTTPQAPYPYSYYGPGYGYTGW